MSGLGGGALPSREQRSPLLRCVRGHPPTVAVCARACTCPRPSEGCSDRGLLTWQRHRKAGLLIQSFMLPLFGLGELR